MQNMPSASSPPSCAAASLAQARCRARKPGATRVLVIEDDTLSRVMLCHLLRDKNYVALEACNGDDGLRRFKADKPDIILMDILMPEKEGLETIRDIRAMDADIPIIAMSGGGWGHDLSYLDMAAKLGASRTIAKPFRPVDMLALIAGLEAGPALAKQV